MQVRSLGWEDPLEEGMASHSSILAWRIPWTEEPGRLQSMGLHGVKEDWRDLSHMSLLKCILLFHSYFTIVVYFFALHLFLVSFPVCFSLPCKSGAFLNYISQPLFCHLLEASWPPKLPVFRKGPYLLTIILKITYCYWHLVWFCLSLPCLSLLRYHAGPMRAGTWIVLFTGVFPVPRTMLRV